MPALAKPQLTMELSKKMYAALAKEGPMRSPELRKSVGLDPKKYSADAQAAIGFALRHKMMWPPV